VCIAPRGDGQILTVDMHRKLEVPEHRRSAGTPLASSLLTTSVRSTLFKAAANYGSNALHSRLRLEQSEHGGGVGHEPHSCSSRAASSRRLRISPSASETPSGTYFRTVSWRARWRRRASATSARHL
jgi:hypothetical protein